jgi:ferritin-like metal-binding protein YciE
MLKEHLKGGGKTNQQKAGTMNLTNNIKNIMGLSDPITDTQGLFTHALKDMYYAEKYLLDSLSNMAEQAFDASLKKAFTAHRQQTVTHVNRLEQVFATLDIEVESNTCEAIRGLVDEANEITMNAEPSQVDEGLTYAALAIEHYEIARYTSLVAWAERLELTAAATLLKQTLAEEMATATQLVSRIESGTPMDAPRGSSRKSTTTSSQNRARSS